MNTPSGIAYVETGVRNLDAVLGGGLPEGSVTVVAGPPGSGKTILAHQICFHRAAPDRRVVYFNTLSEPAAKTLRFLRQFTFFDPAKIGDCVEFVDLGESLRAGTLAATLEAVVQTLERVQPALIVVDSFKVVDDLARSASEMRRFSYELALHVMARQATALLLGEYGPDEYERNPIFSIVDGLVTVTQRVKDGEPQRFLHAIKMRGTAQNRDEHSFAITSDGIQLFTPRVSIVRDATADRGDAPAARLATGIAKLDELLGAGIPRGSSVLVSGAAGTGKTVLALEFVYRGAEKYGERGILFSFEETAERLRAEARGLGWDFERYLAEGLIEIVFIPQPDIVVDQHVMMVLERIAAMGAVRVAIDSVSVFLHKVRDAEAVREKVFQLASIVQRAGAVGFFAMDVPYGSNRISRFGVEETVVDGVILLSAAAEDLERQRYIEVYKLRNTAHLRGRHNMTIGPGGIAIFPRYASDDLARVSATLDPLQRTTSGVPGLDALVGGGLLATSITLVSGSAGIGKSTLATQFILEGARLGERCVFVTLEEAPDQVLQAAASLGLPLWEAVQSGLVELVYLAPQNIQTAQFLSILTDKIRERGARRIAIDGTGHLHSAQLAPDHLRQLMYVLASRFKALGTTTLLTLEAATLYSTDYVADGSLSPIADNLLLLRYLPVDGAMTRALTVVKTRGSAHAVGTFGCELAHGGLRVGGPLDARERDTRPRRARARR